MKRLQIRASSNYNISASVLYLQNIFTLAGDDWPKDNMKKNILHLIFLSIFLMFSLISAIATGQTNYHEKQVTQYNQSWVSLISNLRFTEHWGLMADLQASKQGFFKDDSYYLVRVGAVNWINGKYPVAYGISQTWIAPKEGYNTWSNDFKTYQQWTSLHQEGLFSILHRIRVEQRWREVVVDDQKTGTKLFSIRLRYQAGFEAKVFKSNKLPVISASDELIVQFGKDVVYNAFDQNRFFIGLKQRISSALSFDIGYMNVFQQKTTGYQYDSTDLFRLFFFYMPDWRKTKRS